LAIALAGNTCADRRITLPRHDPMFDGRNAGHFPCPAAEAARLEPVSVGIFQGLFLQFTQAEASGLEPVGQVNNRTGAK